MLETDHRNFSKGKGVGGGGGGGGRVTCRGVGRLFVSLLSLSCMLTLIYA